MSDTNFATEFWFWVVTDWLDRDHSEQAGEIIDQLGLRQGIVLILKLMLDYSQLKKLIEKLKPHIVINCAAEVDFARGS